LNALLAAALLRVVCDAVPMQAPASASVVPSAAVRGFDASVSSGLDASGAARVSTNAAACHAMRPSAGGAAFCQVMDPGPSGVVPSSLVKGATISSNHPRDDLCLPHSTFTPPPEHLGTLTVGNSVSSDLILSCSSC